MKDYVVGFALDKVKQRVLLIEKLRPAWQLGLLNGVGGKREFGETPHMAMCREFLEETGAYIPKQAWRKFSTLIAKDNEWRVFFFSANGEGIAPRQIEEEKPVWVPYLQLPSRVINNLRWLIPMALADAPVYAEVVNRS